MTTQEPRNAAEGPGFRLGDAPMAIIDITDLPKAVIVDINPAGAEVAGSTIEQMKGSPLFDLLPQPDAKVVLENLQLVRDGRMRSYSMDSTALRWDGTPYQAVAEVELLTPLDARPILIRTLWRPADLVPPGANESPEDEIVEVAHLISTGVLAEATVGAAIIDAESRDFIAANRAFARMMDTTLADVVGKPTVPTIAAERIRPVEGQIEDLVAGRIDSFTTAGVIEDPGGTKTRRIATVTTLGPRHPRARYLLVYVHEEPWVEEAGRESLSSMTRQIEAALAGNNPANVLLYTLSVVDAEWRLQLSAPDLRDMGFDSTRMLNESILPFVHPSDLPALLEAGERVRTGQDTAVHLRVYVRLSNTVWAPVDLTVQQPAAMLPGWLSLVVRLGNPEMRGETVQDRLAAVTAAARNDDDPLEHGVSASGEAARLAGDHGLSGREAEILQLVAEGYRVPTISRMLILSRGTVRNYLSSIFRKVGVASQTELVERLRNP